MRTIPSRLLTSILVIVAVFGLGGSRLSPIPAHAQEEGAFFPIHVLACDAFVKYQGSAAGFGYPPECRGLEGITVTAYDTEGVELDDCTTGAEGNCMLAISYNGVRIYRMETDNVPEGYRAESDVQRLFTYTEFGEVTFHTYSEAAFPQRDAPRATVRVHSRVCPENYAGDTFFEDCHDNLPTTNQWIFSSEGYARTGTDGDALLRYAPAGNDTQIIGGQSYLTGDIFFFCSLTDDPSVEIPTTVEVTALYDGITRDFVGRLDLEPQSDVTCDWYQVPFLDRGLWDTVINPLAGEGASDVFAEGTGSLELYLYRCPDGVLPETALEGAEQCTSREHTATVHATTEDGTEYASGTTDAEGHVTLAMDGEAVVPIWLTLDGHASSEQDVLMCAANRSQPGGSTDPLYQATVIDGAAWSIPGLGDDLGGVICSWYLVPTGS